MIIQSKKVWLADQFVPAQIEITDGRITGVYPYGSVRRTGTTAASASCPVSSMSTATAPMALTPMMRRKKACATGCAISSAKA